METTGDMINGIGYQIYKQMTKKTKNLQELEELLEEEIYVQPKSNTIRVQKHERQRQTTTIEINRSVVGDSIETMLDKIREGEGEDSISDRDLVYNDAETDRVNPVTNIRSDKFELMLEEKIGEYEHKENKHLKVVRDEDDKTDKYDEGKEGENGSAGKGGEAK